MFIDSQSVDSFVSHMACDEPDRLKEAKLNALQLSTDEWDHINLFLDLLVVIIFCYHVHFTTYYVFSMLIKHNKHSPQMKAPLFTLDFQHLRPFTKPDLHKPRKQSIITFRLLD